MTGRRRVLLAMALLLTVLATAPMEAANKEHQQMMADLRMLQQQTQALQAQIAALADALKAVSTRMDEQSGTARKVAADSRVQVESVAGDLRVVREKVDETNVRLNSLSQEIEALRVQTAATQAAAAAPVTPLDPAAGGVAPGQPGGAPTVPSPGASLNPGVSPQRLFEEARSNYMAGLWSLSLQGFDAYIKTFPKSDLTDDAQYYIGETHFKALDDKAAVEAYNRLIQNYPTSNTLPEAYYRRGMALANLGQAPAARESFDWVVKNYPETDAGRLARQALDRLNAPRK